MIHWISPYFGFLIHKMGMLLCLPRKVVRRCYEATDAMHLAGSEEIRNVCPHVQWGTSQ